MNLILVFSKVFWYIKKEFGITVSVFLAKSSKSSLSHDTMDCIVTQGSWVQPGVPQYSRAGAGARSKTLRYGLTTRLARATTRPACEQGRATRACGWHRHGVSRDTKFVSWLGVTVWCRDTEQQGCDTA